MWSWRTAPTVLSLILRIFFVHARLYLKRPARPLSGAQSLARLIHIPRDLLRQLVRAREAQLVAQPFHELRADVLAVHIALPIEEERLEATVAAAERGAHAEARGRGDALPLHL